MSDSESIRSRIRDFVFQQFPLAQRNALGDTDSLVERGVLDSMGVLELVTFVESEFDLVLEDDEVASDNFDSIHSLATFVEARLATNSALSSGGH